MKDLSSARQHQRIALLWARLAPMSRISFGAIRPFLLVAALFALLIGQTPAYAIGCSTSQLISAINTAVNGDVITLASSCTYVFSAPYSTSEAALPQINVTLTINGASSIIARNPNAGTPLFRLITVGSSGNLTLNALTLEDGSTDNDGGAIYVDEGILTVANSTLSANTSSSYGGALYNSFGTVTLNNVSLHNNSATGFGGGAIENDGGTLTLAHSELYGNDASADGGAIENDGTLMVDHSTFYGNVSHVDGGAIANKFATLTVSNTTFTENHTINSNGNGGAISNQNGGTAVLSNSTFSGNTANGSGGGIFNESGTVKLGSSIVAENSAALFGPDLRFTIKSLGKNVIGDTSGATITGTTGSNLTNGAASPLNLGAAVHVLGTLVIPLEPGSVAIGHGNCATLAGVTPISTDQRYQPRKTPCDTGAYENNAPVIFGLNDLTINEDTSTGAIAISIGDNETPADSLTLSATSSNTTKIPLANIVFGGSGMNRTVTITPAANQNGTVTVTLKVNDGNTTSSNSAVLTITSVNDLPTITPVNNQQTLINTPAANIPFTIGDVETPASSLTMTGNSSNTTVMPNSGITFGGSGANRTVTLTPAANQTGSSIVTLTVHDGGGDINNIIFIFTVLPAVDAIFSDGFESGSFSAWTASTTDGGDLAVTAGAALVGTRGMRATLDDTTPIYVTDDTPSAEIRYRARFYFDPNTVVMADNDNFALLYGYQGASTIILQVQMHKSGSTYEVRLSTLNDVSVWTYTAYATLSDAPHFLELDWRAASGAGSNNGRLTLWVDDVMQPGITIIDNDTRRIDRARLGAVANIDAGTHGTLFFDAFVSHRRTYIGPEPAGLLGGATMQAQPTPVPFVLTKPPLSDDMEHGASNWTASGNWSLSPAAAFAGGFGWNAAGGSTNVLRWNGQIDLRGVSKVTVSFQSALTSAEQALVQVSFDGETWTTVGVIRQSADWRQASIDLSPFAGQVIQLQLVWASAEAADSWRLDDFAISAS